MSVLINKSKENLTSAQILIENNCYASSVHCSYYSSFQLMSHLLLNNFGFSQDVIKTESKKDGGSHIWSANIIFKKMGKQQEILKAIDFNREIGILRNKRMHADYSDEEIDKKKQQLNKDYSVAALAQAGVINNILSKVFNIVL